MARYQGRRAILHQTLVQYARFKRWQVSRQRSKRKVQPLKGCRRERCRSLSLSSLSSNSFLSTDSATSRSATEASESETSTESDTETSTESLSTDSSRASDSSELTRSSSESSFLSPHQSQPAISRRRRHRHTHRHLLLILRSLYQNRYFRGPRISIPKPPPQLPHVLTTWKIQRPDLFRQELRVTPQAFDRILDLISSDSVFTNSSTNGQMPVDNQLAITLYRFGHFGNAARLQKIANWAGIGKGTVLLATSRVLVALTRSEVIGVAMRPPTAAEKEEAKGWVGQKSCPKWRDGWCFVDGTLIPLFCRPYWFGESYFDRKSNYSLNIQIISLPNLRIIDFGYGATGSMHDATAWKGTQIGKDKASLLEEGEWVWADSAYPIETHVVAPYKKPLRNLAENQEFNECLSGLRIKSEHAIGFLKGRWQSLKGLRVLIKSKRDHYFACYWIVACLVTHNVALMSEQSEREENGEVLGPDHEDPFVQEGLSSSSESDVVGPTRTRGVRQTRLNKAKIFRERLKRRLFQFRGRPLQAGEQAVAAALGESSESESSSSEGENDGDDEWDMDE